MKTNYKKSILLATLALFGWSNVAKTQTVTDIDGNVYNTVTIGTQTWFKENLKVIKYSNGDAIPTTTSTSIPNDSTSKYQWAYNNDNNNVATYGRLYTWWAVTDSRNVCPTGWHVPSDAEWCTLENFVEINTDPTCNLIGWRGTNTGGKLKEAGTSHWYSPNAGADNNSGLTALPGGYRVNSGTFYTIGSGGNWWSATEINAANAWSRYLLYNNADANRYNNYFKSLGFSVRCLSDNTVGINDNIIYPKYKFYPNPSDGMFRILIPDNIIDQTKIEIYNLMGEIVFKQQNKNEIDLSKYPKGIYFVKIYEGAKIYYKKIALQ